MFAKILRIVTKWYGNPTGGQVFPQIFEDAVYAWKTGEFEGVGVFQADDPGGAIAKPVAQVLKSDAAVPDQSTDSDIAAPPSDLKNAGIRIDLTRIGGQK
jgi:hypothetical protein